MGARNGQWNVLVIKSNYGRAGGAETLLSSLLKRLDKGRFRLTLIKLSYEGDYKLPALRDAAAFAINETVVSWRNYFSASSAIRQIRKAVNDLNIDVIYTHDMRADLIGCAVAMLMRVIWVSHVHGWLGQTASLKTRFHEWMDGRLISKADMVLVGSENLRSAIQARHRCKAICVVPNSVDPETLRVAGTEVQTVRRRLGLHRPDVLIGTVGRLHKGKGHDVLLRALAKLRQRYPALRCLIVGEGPHEYSLRALATRLGIAKVVTFAGYCDSVAEYLAAMDVFVTCSFAESLPITLLEAMVLCKPVVATAVGDVERVLDSGKAGMIVEPGHVDGVVRAVRSLLDHPQLARRLAEQGRKRVLAEYSVEKTAQQIEAYLVSACTG